MYTCDQCAELIWDQLYGLLNEDQAQSLREHLAGCPACQTALVEAQSQQRLVARAARLYDSVASFQTPVPEAEAAPEPTPVVAAPQRETLPLPAQPRRGRRRWPWVAAAASVLLMLGSYFWYQKALAQSEEQRAFTRLALRANERQSAAEAQRAQRELNALPRALASRQVYLEVLGSAGYRPDGPNQFRAVTRDLDGKPAPTRLTARLVAVPRNKSAKAAPRVLFEKKLDSPGEKLFSLPAGLKVPGRSVARLEVEARRGAAKAHLAEPLSLLESGYHTRLVTDKSFYHQGEVVFFRTLTLDRFTDKPPAGTLTLRSTLTDPRKTTVVRPEAPIGAGGIGAGCFALTENLAEGECTLEVEVVQAGKKLPPVSRKIMLLPGPESPTSLAESAELQKELHFDRSRYSAGDNVNARFRALKRNGAAAPNVPVTGSVDLGGKRYPLPGPAVRTNARGEADIKFRLPPGATNRARLELQLEQGKSQKETFSRRIPMDEVPRLDVEFFPEGGDLVAGLPGRVYFRVRDHHGRPADLRGDVLNGKKLAIRLETRAQQGLGYFNLTPEAGASYTFRAATAAGVKVQAALPAVRNTGVVLSVSEGVTREGDPLLIRVYQTPLSGRSLLVAVSSRGRLVDQQVVRASRQGTPLRLSLPGGIHGVVRVTVYEPRAQDRLLLPLAERLVYRLPAQRLNISVRPDRQAYQPGERVNLTVETKDEKNRPVTTWLLASVVDQKALTETSRTAASQAGLFYLAGELRQPQDLEQADVWVRDDAQAFAALDRFLGTQGWRRFPPARKEGKKTVLVMKDAKAGRVLAERGGLAVLNLDNAGRVRARYRDELDAARKSLVARYEVRANAYARKNRQLRQEAEQAAADVRAMQDLPRAVWGLALSVLVLVLLATGCLALLIGLARVVRGSATTTPYFATAFASLLLCIGVFLAGKQQDGRNVTRATPRGDQNAETSRHELDDRLGDATPLIREGIPRGVYAALPPRKVVVPARKLDGKEMSTVKALKEKESRLTYEYKKAAAKDKMMLFGKGGKGTDSFRGDRRLYESLKQKQQIRSANPGGRTRKSDRPAPVTAPAAPREKTAKDGAAQSKERAASVPVEYAHVHPADRRGWADVQDTVLWAPMLQATDGIVRAAFDLTDRVATFRVWVYGNTADGRLGMVQGKLQAGAPSAPASKPAKGK